MTGRSIGFGEALAMGLAGGTNNYIGLSNQLEQQRQQQANILADQQYRQQQADQQAQQFAAQQKQARDSQAFQWLQGQQQQLVGILGKGGFGKDTSEYQAAEAALRETNKLMNKTIKGIELTPDEQAGYDTLMGNVGAVTGVGAATIGTRETARDEAALKATETNTTATGDANARANELQPFGVARVGLENRGLGNSVAVAEKYGDPQAAAQLAATQAGTTSTVDANARANELQPFSVAGAGYQNRGQAVAANVAEQTEGAQVRAGNAAADSAEIGVDAARWQLGDLKAKAPLVYEGLRLSNAGAQQALDFNGEMQPERMTALKQQNEQTRQVIDQNKELFPWQKRALTADVNVKEVQAEIVQATKAGAIQRADAENWGALAQALRDPAAFDGLVKSGVMTAEQAAPFKTLAGYYRDSAAAQLDQAKAGARTATVQARVQEGTEAAQIEGVKIGTQQAQTALDAANEQLAAFKDQRPVNLATARANLATLEQALRQDAQLFGPRLAQAQATVGQLQSQLRVMEQTEGAQVITADAGATGAVNAATISGAQATVAVQLIPSQIQAGKIGVQQAQASLESTLKENDFADATFANRVRGVDITTKAGIQQLLTMRQTYGQNAQKFPKELEYLDAQISTQKAQAAQIAAANIGPDGNSVKDRKAMQDALSGMRIINGQNIRTAQATYKVVVDRYFAKAKISVDKYNPKNYQTLLSNANLTPEQAAELENARGALEMYQGESADLSSAFAAVGSKGRIDPKVAERLGLFNPADESGPDPYGTQTIGNVKAVTKFTGTAPIPASFNDQARYSISRTAGRLGVDANALAAVISFETGGSFDPAKRNPRSSATGLIQFMESTAKGMGTTTAALAKMPFDAQMGYVEKYLKGRGIGPGSSMGDIYQAVTGSGYKKGSAEYEQNKVWDSNGNGVIEANEQTLNPAFASHVRDYFAGRQSAGPQVPAGTPAAPAMGSDGKPLPPGWSPAEIAAAVKASAPGAAPAPTSGPLTQQAAKALILQASSAEEAKGIEDRLIAGGMPRSQAIAYIRAIKQGGGR